MLDDSGTAGYLAAFDLGNVTGRRHDRDPAPRADVENDILGPHCTRAERVFVAKGGAGSRYADSRLLAVMRAASHLWLRDH